MPFPLFNLSNDNVGTIVSFHYSNACELLRNADAVAYGMRVSEGIPPHTSPEGLFAHMVEGSHLFKRYQKRSLWRMFGKLLSAQDKKVI